MIRPFTFLTLGAAFASGLYLYSEKHRAELLDRRIAQIIHATEATRQSTSLLRTEWEVLNNPDRLRPLAQKYLNLGPVQPTQYAQLADLANHLPPPVIAAHGGATDDGAAASDAATDDAAPGSANDAPIVVAPANPGIDESAPASRPAPAAQVAAHAAPRKKAPVSVADAEPPLHARPLAHSAPLALATPQPARARVVSAMARSLRVVEPAMASAVPSALGVRASVPAPVPLGVE
jgi:hypothetical protein